MYQWFLLFHFVRQVLSLELSVLYVVRGLSQIKLYHVRLDSIAVISSHLGRMFERYIYCEYASSIPGVRSTSLFRRAMWSWLVEGYFYKLQKTTLSLWVKWPCEVRKIAGQKFSHFCILLGILKLKKYLNIFSTDTT